MTARNPMDDEAYQRGQILGPLFQLRQQRDDLKALVLAERERQDAPVREIEALRKGAEAAEALVRELRAALVVAKQWMPIYPIEKEAKKECAQVDVVLAKSAEPTEEGGMSDDLHREIGETLEAQHGTSILTFRRIPGRYEYDKDKTKCPICGSLGLPWGGWFSCEADPNHVALVHNGEAFLLIKRRPVEPEGAKT